MVIAKAKIDSVNDVYIVAEGLQAAVKYLENNYPNFRICSCIAGTDSNQFPNDKLVIL